MLGAAGLEEEGLTPRLIGILPERGEDVMAPKKPSWDRPLRYRLFLHTGLAHNVRNVINGRTPDVLVAFGGSRGTLAEMAFGLSAGRKVFVHRGFDRLWQNFNKYFGPSVEPVDREVYLEQPLRFYPVAAKGADELVTYLHQMFASGPLREVNAVELADRIAQETSISDSTGFPGLPHEPSAREHFEGIVGEMSK